LSEPRFAVVIVTYNSAAHVGHTLDALAGQLADGDEVLVVDNASSDGTLAAVRSAGGRVRVHAAGANLGFAAGCNLGAAQRVHAAWLWHRVGIEEEQKRRARSGAPGSRS